MFLLGRYHLLVRRKFKWYAKVSFVATRVVCFFLLGIFPEETVKMFSGAHKVAIMTLLIGDADFIDTYMPCLESIKKYCAKYSYELIVIDEKYYDDRPPAWNRIPAIMKLINNRKDITHVLYVDADAMITNYKFSIEPLLWLMKIKDKDILFTIDAANNINDGVAIYKNNNNTMQCLLAAEKQTDYIHHTMWENAAFIKLYLDNEKFRNSVLTINNTRLINSYIRGRCRWQFGDFIVHFAGISHEDRKKIIPSFKRFIDDMDDYLPEIDILEEHVGVGG